MFYSALCESIRKYPNKVAVIHQGEQITFGVLGDKIDAVAGALENHEIREGEFVGTSFRNSIDYIVMVFALARLGAVMVPLGVNTEISHLDHVIKACSPVHFIAEDAEALGARLGRHDVISYATLAAGTRSAQSRVGEHTGIFRCLPTSGSTGTAKLVLSGQQPHLFAIKSWLQYTGWSPDDVAVCIHSLDVSHGIDVHALTSLIAGGTLVLCDPEITPVEVLRELAGNRATIFSALPRQYELLIEAAQQTSGWDLSFLRYPLCGGAYLSGELVAAFHRTFGVKMKRIYGTTEFGMILANLTDTVQADVGMRSLDYLQVRIIKDDGQDAGLGEIGEIIATYAGMGLGYLGDETATAATFRGGWYHSGDLAVYDSRGFYWIKGRKTDAIATPRGFVFAAELEAEMSRHALVREAVLLPLGRAHVCACVLPRNRSESIQVEAVCTAWLARTGVEAVVRIFEDIPRIPSGKPDRIRLRQLWNSEELEHFQRRGESC